MQRNEIKESDINSLLKGIPDLLQESINKHGNLSFINIHETFGVLAEEVYELQKAIHEDNKSDYVYDELEDILRVALWGLLSIRAKNNYDITETY